nr:hypothetical protein [Tanacetum cinerariifolium]
FQDTANAGEEGTQTYVLFPVLSDGSTNPKNNKDAHTGGNKHNDDIQKSDLNEEFAKCINNRSNGVSVAGPSVSAAELDFTNSTNDFTTAGPLVSATELDFTNSTNDFTAAGPLVSAVELDFTNSTNDFTAAGPLVSAVELNFTNNVQ